MTEKRRELRLAVAVAVLVVCGIAFDAIVDDAGPGPRPRPETVLVHRSLFCPPLPRGGDAANQLSIASPASRAVPVTLEPAPEPQRKLARDRVIVEDLTDRSALEVTGYGASVAASTATSLSNPPRGTAASRCADVASPTWYFADGSSSLGYDQRLLIHNPFPDEAVVRVVFFTPRGPQVKASLSDVPVPARSSVDVRVNEFILREPLLSSSVFAIRGRVVAWRMLVAEPDERSPGAQFSLGATRAAESWFFPAGVVASGVDERIAILNPSDEEAVVTISLATRDKAIQPRELVEMAIPPTSSRIVSLAGAVPRSRSPAGVSATVNSTNAVDVVAERTLWYSTAGVKGVASEVGASTSSSQWILGPPTAKADSDVVALMNPVSRDASVELTLLRRDRGPVTPRALSGITVPAGLRVEVRLDRWTRGAPVAVRATADAEVVAERIAYSGAASDVAALMGSALTPSEP